MKHLIFALSVAGLTACSTLPAQNLSPCIAMQIECAESGNIIIIGNASDQAGLLNTALSTSKSFESIFGSPPAKTVIVPGGIISAEQNTAFEKAGYPVSLPWISAADKALLREASILRQVEEQTKNLPEAVKAAALAQALAATKTDTASESTQAGAFSHELGHLWFIEAFKPANAADQTGHAYGGWAPDWLDETAAILMENSILIESRRKAFIEMSDDEIIPLKAFLSMEHPGAQAAVRLNERLAKDRKDGESRTFVLTGEEAEAFLKNSGGNTAANFYSQAQAFSDFLLSYSGDTKLYISLIDELRTGGSFETWLMSQGSNWGLPDSLLQLDQAWKDWISLQK